MKSSSLWSLLVAGVCALALSAAAIAAPTANIISLGQSGGNQLWQLTVSPDLALLPVGGGSLAVELDLLLTGANIISVTKNATAWPNDNPGNNPFTGSVTFGTVTNVPNGQIFSALGSNLFTTGAPVPVLTVTTTATYPATLSLGGRPVLSGPAAYTSARVAQAGINFNGIRASLTIVPEPQTLALAALGLTLVAWKRRQW